MDFGIRGIDPEPRRGYRTRKARDEHLQEFSDAVWQRHEATHAKGGPIQQWPTHSTFKLNWPVEAFQLIVADWKVQRAAAMINTGEPHLRENHFLCARMTGGRWTLVEEIAEEIDHDILDPPDPPEIDWQTRYADELTRRQEIQRDLETGEQGDGIELVMERAALRPNERMVIRAWLAERGLVEPPYGGVIGDIAKELKERPQTVAILLKNALHRLRWLGDTGARNTTSSEPHNVSDNNGHPRGAGAADVRTASPAGRGTERKPRSSRGSRAGSLRGLRSQAAPSAH